MEDIAIIVKQTGIDKVKAEEIYHNNSCDIVASICEIEGFVDNDEKKINKLTPTQEKIKEFREIVDKKDAIMESIIQKNK